MSLIRKNADKGYNKKAQLTQWLRATAVHVWRPLGTHQPSNVSRHLGFLTIGSCSIRWVDPQNPTTPP